MRRTGSHDLEEGAANRPVRLSSAAMRTSFQEQTSVVHATLHLGKDGLRACGDWLALEGEDTLLQVTEARSLLGDSNPATLGSNFNTELGSPFDEAVQAAGFEEFSARLGIDPAPNTDPAVGPIPHVD